MIKLFKLFWILVFVVGAALPLFHMNTAEITEQENRTLAKFPKVHKKGKLNESYGKEFESWLGDRFWGRDQLIDTRFQALYKINGRIENEKAFIGDDGWMFEKRNTVNRPSIERQRKRIERDAKILKAFADRFKDKNIPIYLVLIPEREVLYQKYWEKYYKPKPKLDYAEEITKLLSDYQNIKIISFNVDPNYIQFFQKDDPHPTGLAAVEMVQKSMNYILKGEKVEYGLEGHDYGGTHYLARDLGLPSERSPELRKHIFNPEVYLKYIKKIMKPFKSMHVIGPTCMARTFEQIGRELSDNFFLYPMNKNERQKSRIKLSASIEKMNSRYNHEENNVIIIISFSNLNFLEF